MFKWVGLPLVQSNQSLFLVTELECQYRKGHAIQENLEKYGNLVTSNPIAD